VIAILWYGCYSISIIFQACISFAQVFSHTSEYIPPLPTSSLMSAAKLSPEFSSAMLLSQSSLPVHINTCSAKEAIVPFNGFAWSISKPFGKSGIAAQVHDGEGHVGMVGNGGCLWWETVDAHRLTTGDVRHLARDMGRRNIECEVSFVHDYDDADSVLVMYWKIVDFGAESIAVSFGYKKMPETNSVLFLPTPYICNAYQGLFESNIA